MQVLDINPEEEEEIEGANVDLDSQRKGKSVVIKTTTRQTYFLPVAGLVEPEKLKPGDLVGVNKVSLSLYLIHEKHSYTKYFVRFLQLYWWNVKNVF